MVMRYACKDITFFIPVRLDTICRLENLLMAIRQITKYFDTNILVLEAASYQNKLLPKLLGRNIKYCFVQDTDAVFHRTKYINQAVKNMINTSLIAIWDADVVLPASQIYAAIESLRNKTADVAFPYDGTFLDTSFILREAFIEVGQRVSFLLQNQEKMNTIYGPCMCGGGFLVSKEKYMYSGLENEQFYGWGCEDTERTERWRTLGFRFFRSDGALFHLSHPRGAMNSRFGSKLHRIRAESTLEESRLCSCKDIVKFNTDSYE